MAKTIHEALRDYGQAQRGELRSIELDGLEVNGKPACVYFYPSLTVGEFMQISSMLSDMSNPPLTELAYAAARYLLRDENGATLFASDSQWEQAKKLYPHDFFFDVVAQSGLFEVFFKQAGETSEDTKKP